MSNYYEYKDVKNLIVHRLFKLGDWNVYGYKEDTSDSYTDYYDPEWWSGIAEKNGYVFCVNQHNAEEEIWRTRYPAVKNQADISRQVLEKIEKLKQVTQTRGATEAEERTAKEKIEILMGKPEKETEGTKAEPERYLAYPKHLANPPRCNWHIEKDGIIIDKGTGLLKFSRIPDITKEWEQKEWQEFNTMTKEEFITQTAERQIRKWNTNPTNAYNLAESYYETWQQKYKLLEQFNELISRIDSNCGNRCGEADFTYEKVKVTEYKKENRAVESSGELKVGQCFILKSYFTQGCRKGNVYRIYSITGTRVSAVKLNGKLTKECRGYSGRGNYFRCPLDRLEYWIGNGSIAYAEIREEKIPYEVEKIVRKKTERTPEKPKAETGTPADAGTPEEHMETKTYEIREGTREGAKEIYFTDKPDKSVLQNLKGLGMRWNGKKQCWWGFVSESEIEESIA